MTYKMKGWKGFDLSKHPVTPPTSNQAKKSKGTMKKDTKPYKNKDGTWVYPEGYSKQKKYTERGQSKSASKR